MAGPEKYRVTLPDGTEYEVEGPGERSAANKLSTAVKGAGKGLLDLVGGAENWIEGLPAIGDISRNISEGHQTVGQALSEAAKGSAAAMQALGNHLINPVRGSRQTPLVKSGAANPTRGAESLGLKDVLPGAAAEDPYEKYPRMAANVTGLLLGSRWGAPEGAGGGPKPGGASLPKTASTVTKTGMTVPKGEIPAVPIRHTIDVPAEPPLPKPEVTGTSVVPQGPEARPVLPPRTTTTGTFPLIRSAVPAFPENVSKVGPRMAERPALEPEVRSQVHGGVKKEVAPEAASMAELEDLVKGGVQHDFKGRVHFEQPPAPAPAPEAAPFRMSVPLEDLPKPEKPFSPRIAHQINMQAGDMPPIHRDMNVVGSALNKLIDKFGPDWMAKLAKIHAQGGVEDLLGGKLDEGLGFQPHVHQFGEMAPKDLELSMFMGEGNEAKSLGAAAAKDFAHGAAAKNPKGYTSLQDMVGKYGLDETAKRAGMDIDELKARLSSGGDEGKMLEAMRHQLGADRTARALGMDADEVRAKAGGGPSRLPQRAVEAIKAAAQREIAATGEMTPKTRALMDRIKAEGGSVPLKVALPAGGAALGAAAAPILLPGGEDDPDAPLSKAVVGGLGGLALGLGAANAGSLGRKLMNTRAQSYLTGLAIPKNIAAAGGNTLRAAAEGTAESATAPFREALRLPTNVRNYVNAIKAPEAFHGTLERLPTEAPGKAWEQLNPLQKAGRALKPTQHIGAIDKTAIEALRRAGVSDEVLQRYFLTADRNVFNEAVKLLPEELQPTARTLTRITHPFQRIPSNILAEGYGDVAHLANRFKTLKGIDRRSAATLGSVAGGEALGHWAGNDKRKQLLASVLLAGFGPSTALATMGAIHGVGKSGLGSGAFGGITPIPDIGFDVLNQLRAKNWFGFKPAAVTVAEKMKKGK